ncbi:MAG: M3 family oligoendopeptidase [Acidimicrobiales bacterium]
MTGTGGPPRWDTDSIFPGLDSPEFLAARQDAVDDLARLGDRFDTLGISGDGLGISGDGLGISGDGLGIAGDGLGIAGDGLGIAGGSPDQTAPGELIALEEALEATNTVLDRVEVVGAYLAALVSTDSTDEAAARAEATFAADLTDLSRLTRRLEAWIGRLDPAALVAAAGGAGHAHFLRQAAVGAAHQMPTDQEALLADLRLSGGTAWERLYRDVTSRLCGELDGEQVPVSVLRAMAGNPDPATREAAYRAELDAWTTVGVPLAACLNGIKGEAITANLRRGWGDPLEPVLHGNAVTRSTLDALHAATTESFPDFRRFLQAKARLLGCSRGLPWWDLVAPVPGAMSVSWAECCDEVERSFSTYSPDMAGLARRALSQGWVDAEPRSAKQGGGFCLAVGEGESRILMNFDGSFEGVHTLAHELGHAYHNHVLRARTSIQRQIPMALAETASIFCETIVASARPAAPRGIQPSAPGAAAGRLAGINVELSGATQVVVDIHSRFLFEQELFQRRARAPLAVSELCEIMAGAQAATYGNALDPEAGHPWMWAAKPHYYFVDGHFYNWPYSFGLLFGIGLFARYQAEPDRFRAGYDDLLAGAGMASAAELARRLGIDLDSTDFWRSSLEVLRGRIDEWCDLAGRVEAPGAS